MADLTSIAERLRIAANVLINPQTINPTIDALDAVTAERDQAVQGQERLQQQLMVQQAQQEKLTNKLEEITNTPNKLFEIFSPIIYASILYANANIYFFNKDPARLRATKLQLYLCKELSKLIGKHSGEKIFYEILAESGGLLHFSLEPGSSKTTLLSNIARYKKLLQRKGIYTNEDGQTINIRNDQIYKMLCLWNTLKNYILLAKHDKNKATEGESVIEELLKQISIYGPNKIASIASYYNDIGNFFLSYENNQKAKIYFEQAINLELTRYSTERTVNHYLADAYYGLANANFNAKNLAAANVAIEHCLQIRQILYGERDGRLIETKQFKNKIDSLLHNQPRITICRKVLKMFGQ